jgi:hypothetical protein
MKTLEKMMVYLSGTDFDAYEHVGEQKRRNRIMYSLFNILVSIFVFIGTYHLITLMFQAYDVNGKASISTGIFIIAILASFYFSMLVTLYNIKVLSSYSNIGAIFRIPMSLIFTIVFSLPILMNLFDGKITKELRLENEKKVAHVKFDDNSEIKEEYKKSIKDIEENIPNLDKNINLYNKKADDALDKADNEREGKGFSNKIADCGKKCKEYTNQSEDYLRRVENLNKEKTQKYNDLKDYKEKLNSIIEEEKAEKRIKGNEIKSMETYDIITKAAVLFKLIKEDKFTFYASILAFLFLIVIDLIPIFSKLTEKKDDYDRVLRDKDILNDVKQKAVLHKLLKEIESGNYRPNMMSEIYDVLEK